MEGKSTPTQQSVFNDIFAFCDFRSRQFSQFCEYEIGHSHGFSTACFDGTSMLLVSIVNIFLCLTETEHIPSYAIGNGIVYIFLLRCSFRHLTGVFHVKGTTL